jgi:DNA-binding response OmpR family regulator
MRILTIEDEAELARLIVSALRREGFAADSFATLEDASTAIRTVHYEAIILDLGLPDGDGMTILRRLRCNGNTIPLLILTARDGLEDRIAGLDAGADDYQLKPFHVAELIARLKALLRRPYHALGLRLECGNLAFDTVKRHVEVGGCPVELTRRELSLLEVLLRNVGRVVSKEWIENDLYSFAEEFGSNTVEVHVHRLRRKLGCHGAAVQIHTLRGVGYLLKDASS